MQKRILFQTIRTYNLLVSKEGMLKNSYGKITSQIKGLTVDIKNNKRFDRDDFFILHDTRNGLERIIKEHRYFSDKDYPKNKSDYEIFSVLFKLLHQLVEYVPLTPPKWYKKRK